MRIPSSRPGTEPAAPPAEGVRVDTVLVLADERGKHLGPLTRGRPPCLVSVHGRSVLDWHIAAIQAAGARRIVVVHGYRGEMISAPEVTLVRNERFAVTGALGSLLCAREYFGEGFAVARGDLLFEPSLLRATLECEDELSFVVDHDWEPYQRQRVERPDRYLVRLNDAGERIVGLGAAPPDDEKRAPQPVGLFGVRGVGVERFLMLVERHGVGRLEKLSILDAVRVLTEQGLRPRALPVSGGWLALSTVRDHQLAEELSCPLNGRLLIGR